MLPLIIQLVSESRFEHFHWSWTDLTFSRLLHVPKPLFLDCLYLGPICTIFRFDQPKRNENYCEMSDCDLYI